MKRRVKRMRVGGSMGAGDPGQGGGHGGPSGAGGSRSGNTGGGGGNQATGKGNATTADKMVMDRYIADPNQHIANEREYTSAVNNLGHRFVDTMNNNNTSLENIGNTLAGLFGVGEINPAQQALGASIDNPDASWGVDPLHLGLSGIGMATGLPLGSLYKGAKYLTGYEGPMIGFDGYSDQSPFSNDVVSPQVNNSLLGGGGSTLGGPALGGTNPAAGHGDQSGGAPLPPPLALAALAQPAAAAPGATTPGKDENDLGSTWNNLYQPYTGDYTTYGQRPEHQFFGPSPMARGGAVQKKGFGGLIKKIGKKILPVGIGLGTSALTGSDILGGLAGGVSSKLFGNDWGTAALTGLGSGALSYLSGLSDVDAMGLGGLSGILGNGASSMISPGAAVHGAAGAGGSGWFDSAMDWVKNNPLQTGVGALALAGGIGGAFSKPDEAQYEAPAGAVDDDPAYTDQIRNGGWQMDREQNPQENVSWYTYGQLPEFKFFTDPTYSARTSGLKRGGRPKEARADYGGYLDSPAAGHTPDGPVSGPGDGQSDSVPALLSEGEFVIPADVVSHLGSGSSKAGSDKLTHMMNKVRSHRTAKRGKFPPAAKAPMEYMNG